MSAIQHLIDHWKDFDLSRTGRLVHRDDEEIMQNKSKYSVIAPTNSVDAYLSQSSGKESHFHLSLAPVPFVGDLKEADIFLLMINPSLGYADYGTDACPEFRKALSNNLRQELSDTASLCFALDPNLWWSSWYSYYTKLLGPTLRDYAKTAFGKTHGDALSDLSKRLAILELVPYYSSNAGLIHGSFLERLPSARKARAAAHELLHRAEKGNATVIVRWTSGKDRWGIGDPPKVVKLRARAGFEEAREHVVNRLKSPKGSVISIS